MFDSVEGTASSRSVGYVHVCGVCVCVCVRVCVRVRAHVVVVVVVVCDVVDIFFLRMWCAADCDSHEILAPDLQPLLKVGVGY